MRDNNVNVPKRMRARSSHVSVSFFFSAVASPASNHYHRKYHGIKMRQKVHKLTSNCIGLNRDISPIDSGARVLICGRSSISQLQYYHVRACLPVPKCFCVARIDQSLRGRFHLWRNGTKFFQWGKSMRAYKRLQKLNYISLCWKSLRHVTISRILLPH